MKGRKKIGTTALTRHQHIHVREDEKVRQGLSGDDDEWDAGDFAETPVRVHPGASDEQHGKHTDEERPDREECEAEDIPAVPRWIGGLRSGQDFESGRSTN
jgi:hypothetical protein